MGHHTPKLGARGGVQDPADLDNSVQVVRRDARAPAVRVDLDQHRERRPEGLRLPGRDLGHLGAVEDEGELGSAPLQRRGVRQLRRHDADRVEDVGEAVIEEIFGFPERRDGDPARLPRDR